jgi:hypothetical protein
MKLFAPAYGFFLTRIFQVQSNVLDISTSFAVDPFSVSVSVLVLAFVFIFIFIFIFIFVFVFVFVFVLIFVLILFPFQIFEAN